MNSTPRQTGTPGRLSPWVVGPVLAMGALLHTPIASADAMEDLLKEVRELREETRRLRSEVDTLRRDQGTPASPAAKSTGSANATAAPAAPPSQAKAAESAGGQPHAEEPATGRAGASRYASMLEGPRQVQIYGYGEMNYTRPRHDAAGTTADLRRGVIGFAYAFDDRTRFASELELEHAVTSAEDSGEVAFEQFFVEHDVTDRVSAKAGLFLLPMGYINEVHEPTRYYGVHRNFIETAIIPSTWRELGVGVRTVTESGLRLDGGLVTSFDLTKWDATSGDAADSPLGSIHQEGQQAKARSGAVYAGANYDGIPGYNVGASAFTGGVGQKQPAFASPDARVTLVEAHTRWQPGRWDLSALAAFGRFSNVAALNATFAGLDNPVPDRFGGWYAQAAYRAWSQNERSLVPFVRFERFNTRRGYTGLAAGLGPAGQPDTKVATFGASFYLHPQVVFKADYQRFFNVSSLDRVNVGLGFHF
ncbi:MAG: hypothetical protein U1F52_17825 [Burkholderiales bacterium]